MISFNQYDTEGKDCKGMAFFRVLFPKDSCKARDPQNLKASSCQSQWTEKWSKWGTCNLQLQVATNLAHSKDGKDSKGCILYRSCPVSSNLLSRPCQFQDSSNSSTWFELAMGRGSFFWFVCFCGVVPTLCVDGDVAAGLYRNLGGNVVLLEWETAGASTSSSARLLISDAVWFVFWSQLFGFHLQCDVFSNCKTTASMLKSLRLRNIIAE